MDDDMGSVIILGVQPDLIPAGDMPGQFVILIIVAAEGDADAFRCRDLRDGCLAFFLAAAALFLFLIVFQITEADEFFLYFDGRVVIGQIQLFEQTFKVTDLFFGDFDLRVQSMFSGKTAEEAVTEWYTKYAEDAKAKRVEGF